VAGQPVVPCIGKNLFIHIARGEVSLASAGSELKQPLGLPRPARPTAIQACATGATAVIEIRGLSHAFATVPVLRGVDMTVRAGEVVALVGPNGSGKSTLLRCAAGVLTPDQSAITLAGRLIDRWRPMERARLLAYLPQHVVPTFPVTVREMVAWGRHPYRVGLTAHDPQGGPVVEAALRQMELAHLADHLFPTLSGGEARRCLIASALAQEPRYLLLDEPTSDLDPPHGRALFRHLRRLAGEHLAVLVVTHDLNLAALFADRVVLLTAGRVVAEGRSGEVLQIGLLTEAYGPGLVVGDHPAAPRPTVLAAP
jgi:iron complex transport system ATP-binding protein